MQSIQVMTNELKARPRARSASASVSKVAAIPLPRRDHAIQFCLSRMQQPFGNLTQDFSRYARESLFILCIEPDSLPPPQSCSHTFFYALLNVLRKNRNVSRASRPPRHTFVPKFRCCQAGRIYCLEAALARSARASRRLNLASWITPGGR